MRFKSVMVLAVATAIASVPLYATTATAKSDKAAAKTEKAMTKAEKNKPVFSEKEKSIIEEFFSEKNEEKNKSSKKAKKNKGKQKGLPPGLAKRDTLPPGLQKQLEKNGKLPPGLDKRDLPSDLTSRLPLLDSTLERVIVGDDVVLMRKGVDLILDILRGAAGGNRN